jgi:hypothetical protein
VRERSQMSCRVLLGCGEPPHRGGSGYERRCAASAPAHSGSTAAAAVPISITMTNVTDDIDDSEYGDDPFNSRIGPAGHTRAARKLLEPYFRRALGDLDYFRDVPADVITAVADALPPETLDNAQNDSPTFAELVLLAQELPHATVCGYLVAETRSDERVSLEEIAWRGKRNAMPPLILEHRPDIVRAQGGYVRCWWD